MPFQPIPGEKIEIGGERYHFAEHPGAPGIPYGQEGRAAVVYQLAAERGEQKALKVFKARYRTPGLVTLAEQIAPFAAMQGMEVCSRTILTARRYPELVRRYPDLVYAVLMPWIYGPTWLEIILEGRELSPEESLETAKALIDVLATMEERRLAHCDLSGSNLLLPAFTASSPEDMQSPVALVDVEQMFGPMVERPEILPGGSPGYAHQSATQGLWSSVADRFAGAVLIGEMLGWCDERIRRSAWGESYFNPDEMQKVTSQYTLLRNVLSERWGDEIAKLFQAAWASHSLGDCPTFGEWLARLPLNVRLVAPLSIARVPQVSSGLAGIGVRSTAGSTTSQPDQGHRALKGAVPSRAPAKRKYDKVRRVSIVEQYDTAGDEDVEFPDYQSNVGPSTPAVPLGRLFYNAMVAYKEEDWETARSILEEVVDRDPDYTHNGDSAEDLLVELEGKLDASWLNRPPSTGLLFSSLVVLALVLFVVVVFAMRIMAK